MRRIVSKSFWLMTLAVSLSGCFWFDENDTIQLTAYYQLVITSGGNNFLYHLDPEGETHGTLLSDITATGIVSKYLIVRQNAKYHLFFYITTPAEDGVIDETHIGPLDERDFRRKLYQLIGDSTFRLTPVPR